MFNAYDLSSIQSNIEGRVSSQVRTTWRSGKSVAFEDIASGACLGILCCENGEEIHGLSFL